MAIANCHLCKKNKLQSLTQEYKHLIYKCINCGLISSGLRKAQLRNSNQWCHAYVSEKKYKTPGFKKRLEIIEKHKNHGKILDIGCAAGFFLELTDNQRWETYGIDSCKEILNICRDNINSSNIFLGSLEDQKFSNSLFDVIVIFDTLEHIDNLSDFLFEVKRITKPEGLLAISVPDQEGITSRIMGRHWFDYKKLTHLNFFNLKSLTWAFEKMGFKILVTKKERIYACPSKDIIKKLRKNYPVFCNNYFFNLTEKLLQLFQINTLYLPLEHIYVIAKKEK